MESKNPIQVTDRLFLVLETLAETGPASLAELDHLIDLNKSTLHRLLSSLIHVGYVQQDPESGRYFLSSRLLTLSARILSHMDILDEVRPYLKQLSEDTRETVHFVELDGCEAVYICKEEAYMNTIRMASRVGSRVPLYCSGVGKAMLASMTDEDIRRIWDSSSIRELTPHTVTDYDCFFKEIQEVRRNGFAIDKEENETGVRCIAAGLPNYKGITRYAFSVSAPAARMDGARTAEVARMILETREKILARRQL